MGCLLLRLISYLLQCLCEHLGIVALGHSLWWVLRNLRTDEQRSTGIKQQVYQLLDKHSPGWDGHLDFSVSDAFRKRTLCSRNRVHT